MSKPIVYDNRTEWKNADNQLHREGDLPAIEEANGGKAWYQHGQRHRDGDLPAIECADGTKVWYYYGHHHRDGGLPAVEWPNGTKMWYQHGQLHREGGLPAVECANGSKYWYVHGKEVTEQASKDWWKEQLLEKRKMLMEKVLPVVCWYYRRYPVNGLPRDMSGLIAEAGYPIN